MSGTQKERTELANILTNFLAEVCTYCHNRGIIFTLENPASSYIWKMPAMRKLAEKLAVRRYAHHACMYGGNRDKHTCILSNTNEAHALTKKCDGSHTHLPWGIKWNKGWSFATAEECEYPERLCAEIAKMAAKAAHLPPAAEAPKRRKQKSRPHLEILKQRAGVGRQARGKRMPPRIPEHKEENVTCILSDENDKK